MNSILSKFWISITGLVLIILFIIWISQAFLLKPFYIEERKHTIEDSMNYIENLINKDFNLAHQNESFLDELNTVAFSINSTIVILGADNQPTFIFPMDRRNIPIEKRLHPLLERNIQVYDYIERQEPFTFFNGKGPNQEKNFTFLTMGKPLLSDSHEYIIIFSPLEPIEETTKILIKQLSIISILSLLIGFILSYFLSKWFTKPIIEINDSSKEIAKGNFNIKLRYKDKDEIGALARSIDDMAQQLGQIDTLRKDFISNTTHEFKTPIASIRAYTELLSLNPHNSNEQTGYLKIIEEECSYLDRMVEDILYISEMEGKYSFHLEDLNLCEAVQSSVASLKVLAEEKKLTIHTVLPDNPTIIRADKQRMKQVFNNVLSNAIRYSKQGSAIYIRITESSSSISIQIQDEGIGIPSDELPKIWNRFYKVDKSRSRSKDTGTGLGLSIVKQILELHHFDLRIESEEGKGTTLWIYIPK